ncbi:DUF723 domain-containing protein, partial [Xanthomonas citri pv. citri]|nr:DUF723 domain-containing protein [Xanthomonas citri pv. citri]
GCKKCAGYERTTQDWVSRFEDKFGSAFSYDKFIFSKWDGTVTITCNIHGDFTTTANRHLKAVYGCPQCSVESSTSEFEREIMAYALTLCDDAVAHDRTQIAPMELDVFVPSQKVAIE